MYYFFLLVIYSVMAVLCAKPIWAFLGVMFRERSFDPTVMGDFSHIRTALIVYLVLSFLMGIAGRRHYSYRLKHKEYGEILRFEVKWKMIRRYTVATIAAFAIILVGEATTEQGYLADIKAGYGLQKAVLLLAALFFAGLVLCLGRLLFVRKPKAAVFEEYEEGDPILRAGKNYRKLADEELFPVLMKKSPRQRFSGDFQKAYEEKSTELGEKYLGKYRDQTKYFNKPEEYDDYEKLCDLSVQESWGEVNEWLNKKLGRPEEIDSFPDIVMDFGKARVQCSYRTVNAQGLAKQEMNRARQQAARDAMDQWNEKRDQQERMFNAAFSGGDLRTDQEKYLEGGLNESLYMEGKFQRDVAEDEARRKIEAEYNDEMLDDDDYDVAEFDMKIPLAMNYFRSLGWYIDMVKEDWDKWDKRSDMAPRFYQMLWPVYVAGHPKGTKDLENVKSARNCFLYAIVSAALFLLLKVVSDTIKTWDGLWVIINLGVVFAGLIMAVVVIFFLVQTLGSLKDAVSGIREGGARKVAEQAKACAPALYRQLRFYKLWKKDAPAVAELEAILESYYRTIK